MLLDRDAVLKRLAPLGALHAPLSERTVRGYERRFGVELPRDYRHFVTTIGDGGVGPHYGLFRLREMFGGRDRWFGGDPSRPFLHTRAWNLSERERSTRRYWAARWLDGAVPIAHHGCGYLDWLVVTGEQRGTVWYDGREAGLGLMPLENRGRRVSFSRWYNLWLGSVLRRSGQAP